ncbi:hypothetical protein ZWY2020_019414 [Hordeum vulgare]|nr:hypothetical protein ZWY2020_019414 [Hordeum vulgare]
MNGLPEIHDCPDSIGDMTSLTQFVIDSATPDILEKVKAIKKRLNFVGEVEHNVHVMETSGCSSIVDLVGLTCSELVLKNIQNVRNPEDADRVKLRDKSNIRVLKLFWKNQGGGSVLDRLVPPRTLESFWLVGYRSNEFPDWMLDISSYLPFLSELTLRDLQACDCLPPFGALPNLRRLCLMNIPNLGKIGKEFYGEGGPCMKLRVLLLRSMENLVEWWTTESSEETEEFLIPNLHYLEVQDCPKLKFLPYPPTSMNWVLNNSETIFPEGGFGKLSSSVRPCMMVLTSCSLSPEKWEDRLQHFPTVEIFRVNSVSGLRTLPEAMRCFTSLTLLWLVSLNDLETLPVWLGHLSSLVEIGIRDCPNLTSLPESMKNLTALKILRLLECKGLETLPEWLGQLTCLEILFIDCPNLTCLPESMKNLTALKILRLVRWKGVEILPEWLGQLTCLEELSIGDCPNLTSLPGSIKSLSALKLLRIVLCPNLTARCQGEDAHKICHIPKVLLL